MLISKVESNDEYEEKQNKRQNLLIKNGISVLVLNTIITYRVIWK